MSAKLTSVDRAMANALAYDKAGYITIGEDGKVWANVRMRAGSPKGPCPKPVLMNKAYQLHTNQEYVTIYCGDGVRSSCPVPVNRLVWTRFRGPIPEDMVVVYANGDQADASLGNLKLMSRVAASRMAQAKAAAKKSARGRDTTLDERNELIAQRLRNGDRPSAIAVDVGLTAAYVTRVGKRLGVVRE